jgi:hypothetical protein
MIIVKIKGGLGNQMFQYAFGLSIATKYGKELYLDLTWYDDTSIDTKRKFLLNNFIANYNIASVPMIKKMIGKRTFINLLYSKLENIFLPISFRRYILEKNPQFDSRIVEINRDVYFDGTWMNENYFSINKDYIKDIYSKRPDLNSYQEEIEIQIRQSNSVSVHIRRGDYANSINTNKYHGLVSITYYKNLIEEISQKNPNTHFFFFSDDIDWVRANIISNDNYTYVIQSNDGMEHHDLYLMSICNYNIIANSTFSWWAAWLNSSLQKKVYAPRKWSSTILNSRDILPDNWIVCNY